MYSAFAPIKHSISKFLKFQEVYTDNALFRLHCVFTTSMLAAGSILLTTGQLVGKPIECHARGVDKDWTQAINTFCWARSTFVMPVGFDKEVGKEVAAPGIMNEFEINVAKKYYTYYQWVCFVLFIQAMMCYIPRALWKLREGGLLLQLAGGLNPFCTSDVRESKIRTLVHYMYMHQGTHKYYAFSYWSCELLCLVNILGQMFLMNSFLDGQFMSLGSQLLRVSNKAQEDRNDPLIYVFPRMTKCTFYYFGEGGSIQNTDNLCLLPQNFLSEKVYVFLWFWYIILMALFGILVIYRLVILLVPLTRPYLLRARCLSIPPKTADIISQNTDIGDWWLFYSLARNVHPAVYNELISEYAQRMGFKIGLL